MYLRWWQFPILTVRFFAHGIADGEALRFRLHKRPMMERAQRDCAETKEDGDNWHPGSGPSQVLNWATESLCKAGALSIIGVYASESKRFPIGNAMGKKPDGQDGKLPPPQNTFRT